MTHYMSVYDDPDRVEQAEFDREEATAEARSALPEVERLKQEAKEMILKHQRLESEMRTKTTEERKQLIHDLQDQLYALKMQYSDRSLEFVALHLAWEAVRIAWYAVSSNKDGCNEHIEGLDAAVDWLTGWLFPREAA